MNTRSRLTAGTLAAMLLGTAGAAVLTVSLAGQQTTAPAKPAAKPASQPAPARASTSPATPTASASAKAKPAAAAYKALRTPDGQPDLQGFWTNATLTPLQRPANVATEYVTREEFEKRVAQRAATDDEQTTPGTTADVHYDFSQFGLDKTQSTIAENYRTSLIVDPPDGRIPPQTPEAQKRIAATAAARKAQGAQYDRVQNISLGSRCVVSGGAGPPLMDAGYNANYQIIQAPNTVMILTEMIHDARIIPLDNRPAPPSGYRGWMGSSRGRWEGETLLVETTNFNGRYPFQNSSEHLKVSERFTRSSKEQIAYRFTVEDPSTWTRAWTAEEILQTTVGPIFEHACHEANYGIANTLAGVRLEEKRQAEDAAKKGSK